MVPISSVRISRVPTYSGSCSLLQNFVYGGVTRFALPFQVIRLSIRLLYRGPYPENIMSSVWAGPISLATTLGITIVFFSSGYLDVSVPRVPHATLWIHVTFHDSSPWGFPHSEICGSKLICSSPQLIAACHVLHRLLMPRHSPCALISLNFSKTVNCFSCSLKKSLEFRK